MAAWQATDRSGRHTVGGRKEDGKREAEGRLKGKRQ